jgi:uncharacterized protein YndB with AHSA1/START domain
MTTREATGRVEVRDTTYLVLERTFRAPVEAVWAAVTEPERLARWIGTWTGDPAAGEVAFRMLYEGEDMPPESMRIDACNPPRHLAVTSEMPYDADTGTDQGSATRTTWQMVLDLAEADGVTTLTFAQSLPVPGMAENVGPGWEYYLDRLVVAEDGRDAASVVWDDYYPALREPYQALVARAT